MEQAVGGVIHPEMIGMAALVFALGLRHGFDPDHLVAIDGMTRSTQSRWCGLFFSLGHGVVVTLIGVAVAVAATEWQAPAWLEHTGALLSAGVLVALGGANLLAVVRTPAGRPVRLIGLRGRWVAERLAQANHPAVIAAIGAAFAVSFDTVSQALLFSFSGWIFAALLGGTFTLGMVLTDILNGLWVAKMMSGAASASRWMSATVAFLCLAMAGGGLLTEFVPALALSIASLVLITSVFAFAVLRREASA
jgi:nickel/cobalt transporter (NiCoT) family protein